MSSLLSADYQRIINHKNQSGIYVGIHGIIHHEKINMNNIYKLIALPCGSVKPKGWIKAQVERDLTEGYTGKYDSIHSTVNKHVFEKQDRISRRRLSIVKEWWSGEHEGYWKDAVTRMAFLANQQVYMKKAEQWIHDIISHAGKNGYIGIYKDCEQQGCRFRHKRGNGELWTTSRILMALLAYHEFTNEKKALEAAEKASKLIMTHYKDKNYFAKKLFGGGVSHGIGFFENLEWLYRITGNQDYLDFAVKLYRDFNEGFVRDNDFQTQNLLNKEILFKNHGAHIAEGLFVPEFIASVTKMPEHREAAQNALDKLLKHLTPSGAMRCDEWIKRRPGTADERYEYCGIAEMISPLTRIISFTGNIGLANRIETMVFNAGQGARFPVLSALSYLTSDNRIHISPLALGGREKYDAAHRAAACCALNGPRLMPYYVEGMWMTNPENNALHAIMHGPCELHTKINNVPVHITEETDYPFSDKINFIVEPDSEISFPLVLRLPHGCKDALVDMPGEGQISKDSEKITIRHTWRKKTVISITFHFDIQKIEQPPSKTVKEKGAYIKRGPLVYALPFKHQTKKVKEHKNSGYYRYRLKATDKHKWDYTLNPDDEFTFISLLNGENSTFPFEKPVVKLNGILQDKQGNKHEVELVPIGNTVFRRVTFTQTEY